MFRLNHVSSRSRALSRNHVLPAKRLPMYCALLLALTAKCALGAQPAEDSTARKVDRAVVAALSKAGVPEPKVISDVGLTVPFRTLSQWRLVIVRENGPPPPQAASVEAHGPLTVCFAKGVVPHCARKFSWKIAGEPGWFTTAYDLLATRVVYAGRNHREPLLLLRLCSVLNAYGNCETATELYRYQRGSDRFVREFFNVKGWNNNPATRFVARGPLRGNVIVDYPTTHAPYRYWVEVYKAGKSGKYVRILRYRGHTGYADGNALQVADSEMAEIFRHLGLWHPGDPLPVPAHLPEGCGHVVMRDQEEWCR